MTRRVEPGPAPSAPPPADSACAGLTSLRVTLSTYVATRCNRSYGTGAKASNQESGRVINGFCPTSSLGNETVGPPTDMTLPGHLFSAVAVLLRRAVTGAPTPRFSLLSKGTL